jgi:hypothetical protein
MAKLIIFGDEHGDLFAAAEGNFDILIRSVCINGSASQNPEWQ